MQTTLNLNQDWRFCKTDQLPQSLPTDWETVNLPHTWNAIDGQDGGGDFYRGTCFYAKTLVKSQLPENNRYYLEIRGANSSADVYLNGKNMMHHDGGYSTWRVDLTDDLAEENLLCVAVDNSANETVYPQMADFTFYGGLYRSVNIVCVPESHFDLDYYGGTGLQVTPKIQGKDAQVSIKTYVTGAKEEQTLVYLIEDRAGAPIATVTTPVQETEVSLDIPNVHLWHGRKDPYLYNLQVMLQENGAVVDSVSTRFGCRTFEIHPDNGFILNGEEYPLRGVSRHQDRLGIGNALLPEHHEEDIELICEVGATTIRLAHYQHDQYFYDLCDEKGLVIWAEIPYISRHMPGGRENTINQMKELIVQNYNHPSIVVWGLSNEISMNGTNEDLLENHRILNDLCHEMDPTRKTTIAAVSMCDMNDPYIQIPDVVSYNHYFGWYGGNTDMNGPWFDKFHKTHPNIPIGCSEYGCEALNWHNSDPQQGDYTEEYQAYYHEELIKQLFTRKYMWATHVWNMFDFGADNRSEGGENGQNHKGLVTMDRKYKKDAFYAYKAWLSDEPFVHICGKRYVNRVEDITKVTVYSNQPKVELFVNGKSLGVQESPEHFFYFDVPNVGESTLLAVAGECQDESKINKVEEFDESYRLVERGAILNWFDITAPAGRLSLNDKMDDILATKAGRFIFGIIFKKVKKSMPGDFELSEDIMKMMGGFTVLRMVNMIGMAGAMAGKGEGDKPLVTKEQLLKFNKVLNLIKKAKK